MQLFRSLWSNNIIEKDEKEAKKWKRDFIEVKKIK